MELSELQQRVDAWIRQYGVRYFSELTNMTVLTEEVGELARIMARKYGDQSFKEGEKCNLADEMADVLWVLVCLANQTELAALTLTAGRNLIASSQGNFLLDALFFTGHTLIQTGNLSDFTSCNNRSHYMVSPFVEFYS